MFDLFRKLCIGWECGGFLRAALTVLCDKGGGVMRCVMRLMRGEWSVDAVLRTTSEGR